MELIITALIVGLALFSLGYHFYKSLQSADTDNCGCGGCGGCGCNDTHKSENETKPSKSDPTPKPAKITLISEN